MGGLRCGGFEGVGWFEPLRPPVSPGVRTTDALRTDFVRLRGACVWVVCGLRLACLLGERAGGGVFCGGKCNSSVGVRWIGERDLLVQWWKATCLWGGDAFPVVESGFFVVGSAIPVVESGFFVVGSAVPVQGCARLAHPWFWRRRSGGSGFLGLLDLGFDGGGLGFEGDGGVGAAAGGVGGVAAFDEVAGFGFEAVAGEEGVDELGVGAVGAVEDGAGFDEGGGGDEVFAGFAVEFLDGGDGGAEGGFELGGVAEVFEFGFGFVGG